MNSDLSRFLSAQESTYQTALAEIKSGRKRSHWMWFIFPQLKGLGSSETARFYGIKDGEEARAYLVHQILGFRLREICRELMKLPHSDPYAVFGSPDDLKLKSCATLFFLVEGSEDNVFRHILDKFFGGELDIRTQQLLREQRKNLSKAGFVGSSTSWPLEVELHLPTLNGHYEEVQIYRAADWICGKKAGQYKLS